MKKFGLGILSLIFSLNAFSADFTFTHLSKNLSGNNRYPGICLNSLGERLVIWRGGGNRGMMYTYFKDGAWSKPAAIPKQVQLDGEYLGSDIVVDSENRFHAVWELMNDDAYYASFKDGAWTDPVAIPFPAKYVGWQLSLDIRSNDEVVVCVCAKHQKSKDVVLGYLKKGETNFSRFINTTDDRESSASPAVSVDENDHLWINYKGETFGLGDEVLRACMIHLNDKDELISFDIVSEIEGGFAFLEWVAANKITSVVMATWWARGVFWSRWYNQATQKWSSIRSIGVGTSRHPDFSMWNKVVAQGNDFYCLVKDNQHQLYIIKFNGETQDWEEPILIYEDSTVYFDLYPSDGNIHIVFCTRSEPTQIYYTSMVGSYEPPKIRVKSAVNVQVETQLERSFFKGFYVNRVTWENNPYNIEREVTIDYFNLYRKLKTDAQYGSTPYQAAIPASQFYFEDKSGIEETPLYDYYVTCVTTINGEQFESEIEY